MFRGMSASEYSHKFHTRLELYTRLDLPTFNPVLSFTTEEIIEVIRGRYGLPLNPIYEHMGRTYCICCYPSDVRRQEESGASTEQKSGSGTWMRREPIRWSSG